MTSVWVVRAGRSGEHEDWNLERGRATIGWAEIRDLSGHASRDAVKELVETTYPMAKPMARAIDVAQLWAFRNSIQPGDLMVMPLKTKPGYLAFGRCTGAYGYDPASDPTRRHFRAVDWQTEPVPRSVLKDDLLAMVNGAMTVFSPSRNNAAERLEAVAKTGADPGNGESVTRKVPDPSPAPTPVVVTDPPQVPTLEAIRDRIRIRLVEDFAGHKLTHLVADILRALGYVCEVSPPGPDGGVDIRAGRGPLGLDEPTIVEVKSEPGPVGVAVMRSLHSAMDTNRARQGLLVAMGGVNCPAKAEFKSQRTRIQVWDAEALLEQLFATYPLLPEATRVALPLKQAWVLDDDTDA